MEVRNADNGPAPPSPLPAAAPSKQSKPWPPAVDTNSVTQRLQKELMTLMMSGDLGVSAFPEAENIFCWIGTIEGGIGTSYEGLSFKLSLRFPLDYPFKPPQVKFETACFHPNVDQYGNICLDILQDMWSSAYDCRTILLSIQSLLGEPNIESPLNIYAANLWNNQEVPTLSSVTFRPFLEQYGLVEVALCFPLTCLRFLGGIQGFFNTNTRVWTCVSLGKYASFRQHCICNGILENEYRKMVHKQYLEGGDMLDR